MAVPLLVATKYLCKQSQWRFSHLKLQKLLYVAQMYHLWKYRRPLIRCHFLAGEFSPVISELYRRLREFGSGPVLRVNGVLGLLPLPNGTERTVLDSVMHEIGHFSGVQLIELMRWDQGAWKKNYVRGARYVTIPHEDMVNEWERRLRLTAATSMVNELSIPKLKPTVQSEEAL